jgi:flagellar hook protein FlgE
MLDSIHVGMTGLLGYAKGLRVIANNTANLNTPGFKGSSLQFTDLFYADGGGSGRDAARLGHGLGTAGTHIDFRRGDLRQTANEFDLGLEGDGLFVLRTADGETRYTRAGQFEFDTDGVFVNRSDGSKVVGVDGAGQQSDISLAGLRVSAGKPTTSVRFTGNLSSTGTEQTLPTVKVFDGLGQEHALTVKLSRLENDPMGSWNLQVLEGTSSIATSTMTFVDGRPAAASEKFTFDYQAAGEPVRALTLDFSKDVTSFASGTLSTLGMSSQDGLAPGQLSKVGFDGEGALVATYSNGETAKGARLLLGRFASPDAVRELGANQFGAVDPRGWQFGSPGDAGFGPVRAGVVEMSNVDLSREFSDLVVMQRGYQASSQVISTANDMLQELFRMKAK